MNGEHMKTHITLAFCLALATGANAASKPSYEQVKKITDAVSVVVSDTPTWSKKSFAERSKAMKDADALVVYADRLIGTSIASPLADCRKVALMLKGYVSALNDQIGMPTRDTESTISAGVHGPYAGFALGQAYSECKAAITEQYP